MQTVSSIRSCLSSCPLPWRTRRGTCWSRSSTGYFINWTTSSDLTYTRCVCLFVVCLWVCLFVGLFICWSKSLTGYFINWMISSDLTYTRCVCCCLFVGLFVVCGFVYLLVEVTDRILYKLDNLVRPYVHNVCLLFVCCLWVCLWVCLFASRSH